MSEQRAGRGEGLAGRDTIDTLKNLYDTRGLSGAELLALQEAISALEAAAPPSTAPPAKHELNRWGDLQCKNCGLGLGRWPSEPECTPAALATPPPQAPRPDCELLSSPNSVLAFDDELNPEQEEQSRVFSTTSAREQSSATASNSPSATYYVGNCTCCSPGLGSWEIFYFTGHPMRWSSMDKKLVESVCELLNIAASNKPRVPESPAATGGSPRKVGEDGDSHLSGRIAARLDEYKFVAQMISGVEKEDWFKRRVANLESMYAASSVPVGEQKQEEGV